MNTENQEILTLTDEAAQELKERLAGQNPGVGLRISVEEGGCSGMRYGMCFDEKQADDSVVEQDGISVFIDPNSAGYLRGAILDFSTELIGGGFTIHNPNARESCGCGHSFHT